MSSDDFILRLIQQLRAPELAGMPLDGENAEAFAAYLEWMLAQPQRPANSIHCVGNDEEDRQIVAEALERAARGPAFTSPSWTRNFSELLAWCLRHNYPLTPQGLHDALPGMVADRTAAYRAMLAAGRELKKKTSKPEPQ